GLPPKTNPPRTSPGRGGLGSTNLFRLELDAETCHDSGRADVVARRRSSKDGALEYLGAWIARKARSKTAAHLSPGRADIDIEMLVQSIVGQERYLIIAAAALIGARAT